MDVSLLELAQLELSAGSAVEFLHPRWNLAVVADDQNVLHTYPELTRQRVSTALDHNEPLSSLGECRRIRMLPGVPGDGQTVRQDAEAATVITPDDIRRVFSSRQTEFILDRCPQGFLLVIGSGSCHHGSRRCSQGVVMTLGPRGRIWGVPGTVSFEGIHTRLETDAGINGGLNAEGVTVLDDQLVLAHRGNSVGGQSAFIYVRLAEVIQSIFDDHSVDAAEITRVQPVNLGSRYMDIGGVSLAVPLHLTDTCALSDGSLLFTAAAEGLYGTPVSGHLGGSMIGIMQPDGLVSHRYEPSDRSLKLEGCCGWFNARGQLDAVFVPDPDDPKKLASLYAARLSD